MIKYRISNDLFSSHRYIVDLIDRESNILEVGCATGYISKRLKKKGCKVIGVEIDKAAANVAKNFCNKVIIGDIELISVLPVRIGYFDTILFGDVLEHLKEPALTLKKLKIYLRENGNLICSIPNVAYWYQRISLLTGRWDYTDEGILDWGHLRFFTLKSIKDMIADSGFEIVTIKSNLRLPFFNFLRSKNYIRKIELSIAKVRPPLFAYQFIIKAAKK